MDGKDPPTTLLAIDDDADILMVLKANLELHGFNLLTADSLAAARALLAVRSPALVLLDLMLPDGDGMDFCRFLKARYPHLPVIMLTARDKVADRVAGLELGADDYLVKPFATAELLARIRARLRPAASPLPEMLSAGDLRVDLKNQTVRKGGSEVPLTPKEFQLLALLATNRGNLVTREEIRRQLWGDAKLYSWSRVIDVHIQHLRRKIEVNPAEPRHIITILGRGYRFQCQS
jgi:DNA-binding response OmpR family regulator